MKFSLPIYHDFWMDNGLENFYILLKEIQDNFPNVVEVELLPEALHLEINDGKRFAELAANAIETRRDSHVFYWEADGETGVSVNKKKSFIPLQYAKKVGNRNSLKEKAYNYSGAVEIFTQALSFSKGRGKRKRCLLCESEFSGKVTAFKQAIYPMVTKTKAFSGTRTKIGADGVSAAGLTYNFDNICPWCYLTGVLEWADKGLIYRSFIGMKPQKPGISVVLLPAQRFPDLQRLHEIKQNYVPLLNMQDKTSNLKIRVQRTHKDDGSVDEPSEEVSPSPDLSFRERIEYQEQFPDAKYTMLLGFYEHLIFRIATETKRIDFDTVQRRITDSWLVLEIPEGTVKNIRLYRLVVDNEQIRALARFVEANACFYAQFVGTLWLAGDDGKPLKDTDARTAIRETMAQAFLEDNFNRFAQIFLPSKKYRLVISNEAGEALEKILQIWRWERMSLEPEKLETVKKAGRAVAKVAGKNLSLYYSIERARSLNELLEALAQVGHKLIGLEAEELKYVSLESIEKLVELLHQVSEQPRLLEDVRNTLTIFAAVAYAQQTFHGGGNNG